MRENLKYILTLATICFITATLLTGVYLLTTPKILKQKLQAQRQALEEVLPQARFFEPVLDNGETLYFRGYISADKKEFAGYAFSTQAKGYSSIIETMAGMDSEGKITGVKILSQNETPGLGAKVEEVLVQKTLWQAIQERFSSKQKPEELQAEPWFCSQFKGKRIEDLFVVQQGRTKHIQAITGATISSQALTDSVREQAREILELENGE